MTKIQLTNMFIFLCTVALVCTLGISFFSWQQGGLTSVLMYRGVGPTYSMSYVVVSEAPATVWDNDNAILATSPSIAVAEPPDNATVEPTATSEPLTIEERVEECMRMTNLDSEPLLTQAKENARYFYDEYRKAIPEKGLSGYRSHCWRGTYSTTWNKARKIMNGRVDNVTFSKNTSAPIYYPYGAIYSHLTQHYHQRFESNIVCLPNLFVIGYEKCGSTFLFSFIDDLISKSIGNDKLRQISKEPQFWARFEAYEVKKMRVPKVEDLGRYLINYIPGMEAVSKLNTTDALLIDGTPNYATEWPVFTKTENNKSNYCLLPAALPTLLPNSKYVAIMRNPIDMVYSNFWWSCTKNSIKIPQQAKGPDIFHKRIITKIHTFNDCMRNESDPSISSPCELDSEKNYSACIGQRLHLLDRCSADLISNEFSPELPRCGESSLYYGIYYIHMRKWLSLVGGESILLLTLEELNQNPNKIATDLLHFLELSPLSAGDIDSFTSDIMKSGKKNTQNKVHYKSDTQLQMRPDTKRALEVFYHPFNALLAELVDSDEFMWF